MKKEKSTFITLALRIATGFVLGLCLLIWPDRVLNWLPVILGIVILLVTAIELVKTISLWHKGYALWWLPLIFCVVLAFPGILLITRQNISSESLVRLLGCSALMAAILELFIPLGKRHAAKMPSASPDDSTDASFSSDPYLDLPENDDLEDL